MIQNEGERCSIQTDIQRIDHCLQHGNAVVQLQHGGHVGRKDGDGVAFANAFSGKGTRKLPAARIVLRIGAAQTPMNNGCFVGVNAGGAAQKRDRGKRLMVCGVLVQILIINASHGFSPLFNLFAEGLFTMKFAGSGRISPISLFDGNCVFSGHFKPGAGEYELVRPQKGGTS